MQDNRTGPENSMLTVAFDPVALFVMRSRNNEQSLGNLLVVLPVLARREDRVEPLLGLV